ncbi:UNKNOWN [Stylonychia lemnae]|uniref:Uncharacterized protein n=1 Tax=Stylonychia lemnae TaxID=5949 RepID=A0A078AQB2_STYLE|nr:UNKNOWN [Stylonychia lemnae]|eukprot:CDW84141.1 UNKNOWN [Stylonychia lemnae]
MQDNRSVNSSSQQQHRQQNYRKQSSDTFELKLNDESIDSRQNDRYKVNVSSKLQTHSPSLQKHSLLHFNSTQVDQDNSVLLPKPSIFTPERNLSIVEEDPLTSKNTPGSVQAQIADKRGFHRLRTLLINKQLSSQENSALLKSSFNQSTQLGQQDSQGNSGTLQPPQKRKLTFQRKQSSQDSEPMTATRIGKNRITPSEIKNKINNQKKSKYSHLSKSEMISPKKKVSHPPKKVGFQDDGNVVRLFDSNGFILDIKYTTEDLKQNVQNLQHYLPDFGYQEQIEFGKQKHGWKFFLDLISRYRQREKISNAISKMKKIKSEEQELNQQHRMQQQQDRQGLYGIQPKKSSMNFPMQINNTPHENWLLWNFRRGKESKKISGLEIKMIQLKEDLDSIKRQCYQDERWYTLYKRLVSGKQDSQQLSKSQDNRKRLQRRGAGLQIDVGTITNKRRYRILKQMTENTVKSFLNIEEIDNFSQSAQKANNPQGRATPGLDLKTLKDMENIRKDTEMFRQKMNKSENSWYVNKPENIKQITLNRPSSQTRIDLLNFLFELYKEHDHSLYINQYHHRHNRSQNAIDVINAIGQDHHISNSERLKVIKHLIDIFSKNDLYQIANLNLDHIRDLFEDTDYYLDLITLLDDYMENAKISGEEGDLTSRNEKPMSNSEVKANYSQSSSNYKIKMLKPLMSNKSKQSKVCFSALNSPLPSIRNDGGRLSMEENIVKIQCDYSPINLNPLRRSVQNKQLQELKILTAHNHPSNYPQNASYHQNNRYSTNISNQTTQEAPPLYIKQNLNKTQSKLDRQSLDEFSNYHSTRAGSNPLFNNKKILTEIYKRKIRLVDKSYVVERLTQPSILSYSHQIKVTSQEDASLVNIDAEEVQLNSDYFDSQVRSQMKRSYHL